MSKRAATCARLTKRAVAMGSVRRPDIVVRPTAGRGQRYFTTG
jgi:hypothetical protein